MASIHYDIVADAIARIDDARLPHPMGPLLASFVFQALNPQLAAKFVLEACNSDTDENATCLSLVATWKYIVESATKHGSAPELLDSITKAEIIRRDGARCCITGKAGRYGDPLAVAHVMPIPLGWVANENVQVHAMLTAFLTHAYFQWWLANAQDPGRINPYHNHWLVSKSAAQAFSDGAVKLERLQPSMVEYEAQNVCIRLLDPITFDGAFPLLGDHSRCRIQKVDARFIGTHARLCASVQWLKLAEDFAANKKLKPQTISGNILPPFVSFSKDSSFLSIFTVFLLAVWLMVPDRIRVSAYKVLQIIGKRLYGQSTCQVQRLPFGLYLKSLHPPPGLRNEFSALQAVRHYTSVPVPRPIDIVCIPLKPREPSPWEIFHTHDAYLLTTRMPGRTLAECQDVLSDQDAADFVSQMQDFVTQLRSIPKMVSPDYAICNIVGEACRDPRIREGDPIGPFADEEAFSQFLRNPDDPIRRGHNIVFTHADLNARNILVDQITHNDGSKRWQVTGIVDWENSGYYPEYWEYTKSLFEGFRYSQRMRDLYHEIFKHFGDLSREFEVEHRSWEEGDYV